MFFKAIKIKAQVYHLHDPELIPCGILLRCLGKKVILDIHENIAEDIFDKHWIRNRRLAYTLFSLFEWLACKLFYILLAEHSYEKRYKRLSKRYAVVLNYVDNDFFAPFRNTRKGSEKGINLFYIGIVLENRGILQICQAIHILKQEGIVCHFHVVGELYTELSGKIKALAYYSEIEGLLHFHGRMPLEQGYGMARDMDIGMCIIWSMNNSRESYPTKLFEYMSIGLPVITSNFPLYKKVIEENETGICVDPMNESEIAEAIKSIHMNVEKSERMSERGILEAKNKYDWRSQEQVLMGVYENIGGHGK